MTDKLDFHIINKMDDISFKGVEFYQGFRIEQGGKLKYFNLLFVDDKKDINKFVSISFIKEADEFELLLTTENGELEDETDTFKTEKDLFTYLQDIDFSKQDYCNDDVMVSNFPVIMMKRKEMVINNNIGSIESIKRGETDNFNYLLDN